MAKPPETDPSSPESIEFTPEVLDKTVIAIPLLRILGDEQKDREEARRKRRRVEPLKLHGVILDLNLEYRLGRERCRDRVRDLVAEAINNAATSTGIDRTPQGINETKSEFSSQYMFAKLEASVIRELARLNNQNQERGETGLQPTPRTTQRPIYRIWPDFKIKKLTTKSVSTVKADAARVSFSALGEDVVWAVVDSGIDKEHPHFHKHGNLELKDPLCHRDFTGEGDGDETARALRDDYGHGTHVAGIIAGAMSIADDEPGEPTKIRAVTRHRDEHDEVTYESMELPAISGMAPKCKLVSLKVLDKQGDGEASSLIAAIEQIQRINDYGRRVRIHGVNMSVGYEFEPEWFACGQSPLCVEVDLLVRSGVVVVVAAGNTGYGYNQDFRKGAVAAGLDLTINDPGNAELAITVGSTHREAPHVYGVSYFSSKGPTGDGRIKPDLVAPGEKILSCAAGESLQKAKEKVKGDCEYIEDSGTSMAAPHVSGVIAAFLSVRREFIGRPETVKDIFTSSATDLKRDRNFQGHGLVDLMRAIQSV